MPTPERIDHLQYDNGQIYLSSGQVLNASTGAVAGTFYNTPTAAANGPSFPTRRWGAPSWRVLLVYRQRL